MERETVSATALFEAPADDELAAALLDYLRAAHGTTGLAFASPPARILGGFDTLVYGFSLRAPSAALAGPLILRLYRDADGPPRAQREAAVQNAAAGLGYPTPRVLDVCVDRGVLGGAFQVMQRLPGRVMLDAFFGPALLRLPIVLADLHLRLHALDATCFPAHLALPGEPAPLERDFSQAAAAITHARLDDLQPLLAWLRAHRPPPAATVLCHGDFHPLNVLVDGGAVSGVLDWARARLAEPAWDVGASVALFMQGPLRMPAALQGIAAALRRWLANRYVRAYARRRPLSGASLRYYEALRCFGFLIEGGEHQRAGAGVIAAIAKPTAFGDARTLAAIHRRLAKLTR
ncbi:MAG: phosphotransferase family protein [Candidatus Binatia bacterium]